MSRRQFAVTCASMATWLLEPRCLLGRNRDRAPLQLIIVSDTHLGYRDQESAARQWEKMSRELAAAPGDVVLHLGDVVDGGREAQYPNYLAARQAIGKSVHEIPGNHDEVEPFKRLLANPIDRAVDIDWLRILLLNNARRDSHDGFLSAEQLGWLDAQCRQAASDDRLLAIAMHVPAHSNKHPDRGWYVKPENGQTAFYEIVDRHADRLLMLMHGHFHNGVRGWSDRGLVHEVSFPSALYNLDRHLTAQGAPGFNLPEFRPGFTLVDIREGHIQLRYKPLAAEAQAERNLETVRQSAGIPFSGEPSPAEN